MAFRLRAIGSLVQNTSALAPPTPHFPHNIILLYLLQMSVAQYFPTGTWELLTSISVLLNGITILGLQYEVSPQYFYLEIKLINLQNYKLRMRLDKIERTKEAPTEP